jgi:cholesterol transport system auxiliary component
MKRSPVPLLAACLVMPLAIPLAGCGGLFESKLAAPQAYVLRLPPAPGAAAQPPAGSILVQRPEAGPGLNSDRIALVRSDRRFDVFAASRWAAPAPELVESVLLDALRGTGSFAAVLDDSAPFAPHYDLRVTLRRFEADYSSNGSGATGAPTVHVVLDCTLGRHRDRRLLSSFTAQGSARAEQDRLGSVVAAFESATAGAVAELLRATHAALATEQAAGGAAGASESR